VLEVKRFSEVRGSHYILAALSLSGNPVKQFPIEQEVLRRTNFPAFPTWNLFEVLKPNLMERNLSALASTSLSSI
jgi:hypothetical protein